MNLCKIKDVFENSKEVNLCHFIAITSNDEIVIIYDNSKIAIKFKHINDDIVKRIIEDNEDFEKMRNVLNMLRTYDGTLIIHDERESNSSNGTGNRKLVIGNQSYIDIYYNNIMYQFKFMKYIEQYDKINDFLFTLEKVDIFDKISIKNVCKCCQEKAKNKLI